MRSESCDIWDRLEKSTKKRIIIEGPPGVGKSSLVWAWVLWRAQKEVVVWLHIHRDRPLRLVLLNISQGKYYDITDNKSAVELLSEIHPLVIRGGSRI